MIRPKKLLGMLLLFAATFFFFTEVFLPKLASSAQAKTIQPVADSFLEQLALKRLENFSFDELKFNDGSSGLDLDPNETIPPYFTLTVPRLDLKNVKVETNSVDTTPNEMLGHYKGSSLPGKSGNTFIYGHSTLPSHFDLNNYKTLFTFLPKLEKGDAIIINYNGEEFKYLVERKEVYKPEELEPLKYRYLPYSSVSLVTCTPPGTTNERTVVFAKQTY